MKRVMWGVLSAVYLAGFAWLAFTSRPTPVGDQPRGHQALCADLATKLKELHDGSPRARDVATLIEANTRDPHIKEDAELVSRERGAADEVVARGNIEAWLTHECKQ